MADSNDIYEPPPYERVVMSKRFDPRQKLEENTRRRTQRESQAFIAAEEARIAASQVAGSRMPTVLGPSQRSMRGDVSPRQPRLTDQAMDAPSCGCQTNTDDLQQRDRIVMPKRFNPQRKLQDKMAQRSETQEDYEYIWPRDVPPREQPVQGDYEYLWPRDSPRREQPVQGDNEYLAPRDSPRRAPMTKLNDLPTSESQASSPQFHAQQQPPVRNKTSSLLRKRPVLARWPYAFSDLDSESPSKRAKIEHPSQQRKIAPPVAPKPERPYFAAGSTQQRSDQTVIAEQPVTQNLVQSPIALNPALTPRPRASPYLEPTAIAEYPSEPMKVPPQKPTRKRQFRIRSATDEQDQFVSAGQPRPDEPPLQSPKIEAAEPRLDAFCTSASVFALNGTNFGDFLGDKNAALVMFYKPFKSSCVKGRKYFVKAAESNQREKSAFAAVDCSLEESLCLKEGINTVPTYKVYAQGQLINTVKDFLFFNDRSMKRFMDNVPPFTQDGIIKPPCRADTWLKKAMQKLNL